MIHLDHALLSQDPRDIDRPVFRPTPEGRVVDIEDNCPQSRVRNRRRTEALLRTGEHTWPRPWEVNRGDWLAVP